MEWSSSVNLPQLSYGALGNSLEKWRPFLTVHSKVPICVTLLLNSLVLLCFTWMKSSSVRNVDCWDTCTNWSIATKKFHTELKLLYTCFCKVWYRLDNLTDQFIFYGAICIFHHKSLAFVALQRDNTENLKQIFPEKKLCGLSPSWDCSAYPDAGKYVDRSWEYINRSQTHECGNWDWGHPIRFLGIT